MNHSRLPVRLAFLTLLAALVSMSVQAQTQAQSVFLTTAEITASNSSTPPVDATDWRAVPLPRSWMRDELHPTESREAWYRIALPANAKEDNWNHILILRHMMNLEIWLNDSYLGSAGPISNPASARLHRNWNRPVLWSIPPALITDEPQTLYFRLLSEPRFGVMSPVILGTEQALQARYNINYFLQIDLVKFSLVAVLFIGFLSLFIWYKTRDSSWSMIGLMSISWALPLLYIILPTAPPGEFIFLRLSHWGTAAGAVSLLAFIYSYYLSVDLYKLRWLTLIPVIHGLFLATIPDLQVVIVGSVGQLLCQLLFILLMVKLLRRFHPPDSSIIALLVGLGIMLLAALHDVTLVTSANTERWRWDMPVSYITQPVMLFILSWQGVRALLNGMAALDAANQVLQDKLQAAEENIRQVFARQEMLEREIRVDAEKELVYRDLHDDLGARLLSLVFQSEKGFAQDLARSALQDLRDIVSRVLSDEQSASAVIADSMAEQFNRASVLQKSLDWEIDAALDDALCSSKLMLGLRLLLRELMGICLRTPDVRNVRIHAAMQDIEILTLTLRNDSSQMLSLSSLLQKRLQVLGGVVEENVLSTSGARIKLCLPMPREHVPQTG